MRKKLLPILLTVLMLSVLLVPAAGAQPPIRVIIDGQEKYFDPAPSIVNSSTLVPMRAFFQSLGASVNWDGATRTITSTKGDITVKLTIDSPTAYINGTATKLAAPAQLIGSSTFVPLRFVGEALGASVHYANRVITITSPVPEPAAPVIAAEVHFIDVGQGDAILIKSDGHAALIDAGESWAGKQVADYLSAQGVKRLDALISTHAHSDHIGGMVAVLNAVAVGRVIDPAVPHTSNTYARYLERINELNIPFEQADKQVISLGEGVALQVLGPVREYSDLNNSSVVTKLTAGTVSVLLAGDIEQAAERDLLASGANLVAQVLKVSHHAGNTSTSADFLAAVKPKVAVISVGAVNSYGHPHPEVLDRLSGIDVYRTDLHGTIIVATDGKVYEITTSKEAALPEPEPEPEPETNIVYVTKSGTKYHVAGCRYLSSSSIAKSLDEVRGKYEPCTVCNPPR